jgi:hypothetical protein
MEKSIPGSIAWLRHRAASAGRAGCWEYDPARRLVMVRLPSRGESLDLDLEVCSQRYPVARRWVIVRRSEDRWTISPTLWPDSPLMVARQSRFHPDLPIGEIELTCAPPEVQAELATLEAAR